VSRSSAVASKATGSDRPQIADKLRWATVWIEINNEITRKTPPVCATLDYVVVKIPAANLKNPGAEPVLGNQ